MKHLCYNLIWLLCAGLAHAQAPQVELAWLADSLETGRPTTLEVRVSYSPGQPFELMDSARHFHPFDLLGAETVQDADGLLIQHYTLRTWAVEPVQQIQMGYSWVAGGGLQLNYTPPLTIPLALRVDTTRIADLLYEKDLARLSDEASIATSTWQQWLLWGGLVTVGVLVLLLWAFRGRLRKWWAARKLAQLCSTDLAKVDAVCKQLEAKTCTPAAACDALMQIWPPVLARRHAAMPRLTAQTYTDLQQWVRQLRNPPRHIEVLLLLAGTHSRLAYAGEEVPPAQVLGLAAQLQDMLRDEYAHQKAEIWK